MRKINLIWISALFLLFAAINVSAYTDCTPSSCEPVYNDYNVTCEGPTCVRSCKMEICKQDWTQVHSDTFGFDDDRNEDNDQASGYSPTTSRCYNFTYQGPPDSVSYRRMNVDDPASGDCDSEAIGGFWDNTQKSSPWFSGMNAYIGNVGDPEYDYLLKIMRAHAQDDSDSQYHADVTIRDQVFCAPNSYACSGIGGSIVCDTDCYSRSTIMMMSQGYYVDDTPGSDTPSENDDTLYNDDECGDNLGGATDYVATNRLNNAQYIVYASTLINESDDQSCDRTHEAPSASSVRVLPEFPNAGQDLLCNYTYSDPENFTEQNSSYEWWKNSVNQNINNQILTKGNLTPGEQWYCKVTPSDGLLFGTKQQSSNTVVILNTTQNPAFYVENTLVSAESGYFGTEKNIIDFNQELNNALNDCTQDAEGFCNISLTFSSNNTGLLNLTDLGVYYTEGPTPPDTTPPDITILHPVNNTLYNTTTLDLNFTSNKPLDWCAYSLDNGTNNTAICPNGTQTNITLTDLSQGKHNIIIYGNDSAGNIGQSDVYFNVSYPDINKFYIKNTTGANIAWFGDAGNIVLKGSLEQNSNFQRTSTFAFVIRNNGEDVLIIENNGSMYIDGNLSQNQDTIMTDWNKNDFRVKGNNELVINVNETGYVFLKGTLTENGNP